MASGKILRFKFIYPGAAPAGKDTFIYGDPDELDLFFKAESLDVQGDLDAAIRSVAVKGFSRRQYPGDSSRVSRGSSNRRYAIAEDYSRVALPGRPFWCEYVLTAPGVKPRKMRVRQFTVQGAFTPIRVHRSTWAARSLVVRSPSGRGWSAGSTPTAPG